MTCLTFSFWTDWDLNLWLFSSEPCLLWLPYLVTNEEFSWQFYGLSNIFESKKTAALSPILGTWLTLSSCIPFLHTSLMFFWCLGLLILTGPWVLVLALLKSSDFIKIGCKFSQSDTFFPLILSRRLSLALKVWGGFEIFIALLETRMLLVIGLELRLLWFYASLVRFRPP